MLNREGALINLLAVVVGALLVYTFVYTLWWAPKNLSKKDDKS
jgi:hypothetical protein